MAAKPRKPRKERLTKAEYRRRIINESKRRRGKAQNIGRPTVYDPDFTLLVLELGEQGASNEKIINTIGCSKKTFYEWCRIYPDFLNAVGKAKISRLAWWEDAAQGQASGKIKGNSGITKFVMENISANVNEVESTPYKSKIEFDGRTEVVKDVKTLSNDEIDNMDADAKRRMIEALKGKVEVADD